VKTVFRSWLRRRNEGPARPVGIGHSHLEALRDAWATRDQPGTEHPAGHFLQMLAPEYNPNLSPDATLNPALRAALDEALSAKGATPVLFDCISGNEYHFIGLTNHPRPFDFALAARPDLPPQTGAEIIPAALMRATLHAHIAPALATMTALRRATDLPIWHVQSPPPLPDNDYIRQNASVFAAQIAEHGVAPASLRMKLWLLQSEIYRAHCEAIGIRFVPVPAAVCDAAGFLLRAGWVWDPAHSNAWYGAHVLDQLESLAAAARRDRAA
jgi:nicotinamidase-related amidase